jgi:hypothetical protein
MPVRRHRPSGSVRLAGRSTLGRNTQAAIRQRLEAGEAATPALLRGEGLGRTPTEFVQYRTAMMDVDDARERAKYRREFEKWAPEGGVSADTSAHVEQAERRPRRRRSGSPSSREGPTGP